MTPVAQLDSYKGLLFATFDPEAPPLSEYLGEMTWYLDTFFDRREGGIEVVGAHKWVMPCNWKFPAENFGGNSYHVQWTHFRRSRPPSARRRNQAELHREHGVPRQWSYPDLHRAERRRRPADAEILEYEKEIRPEVEKRLGPRAGLINPIVGTMFPNFSMLRATSRSFRVWHPRGPDKTEVWSWIFADKAAPPHVKEAIRLAGVRGFSPSGTFEQDDMDNWQECTRTCHGVVSRRMDLNKQMGLGHERFDKSLNAWASDLRISESNHRQFYPVGPGDGRRALGRIVGHLRCAMKSSAKSSGSSTRRPGSSTSGGFTSGSNCLPTMYAIGWSAGATGTQEEQSHCCARSGRYDNDGSTEDDELAILDENKETLTDELRGSTPAWPGRRTRRRARAI